MANGAKQEELVLNDDGMEEDDLDIEILDDEDDDLEPKPKDEPESKTPASTPEPIQRNDETNAQYEQRIAESDRRAADAEARLAAAEEAKASADRNEVQWQINFADERAANIESTINSLNHQLAAAEEEGDTARKIDIQAQIEDQREKKAEVRQAKTSLSAKLSQLGDAPKKVKTPPKEAAPNQPSHEDSRREQKTLEPEGLDWAQRNPWISSPRDKDEILKRHYALEEDKKLQNDSNFRVGTRAYYDELDRRINKQMGDTDKSGGKRSVVSGAPSGEGGKPSSRNKVVLGADDIQMIRAMGLNPDDKEVIREYALNKRDTMNDDADEASEKNPIRISKKYNK